MRMAGFVVVTLAGLVGTVALIHGQTRMVDFEQDALGQAPEGFELGHTAKVGAPGRWLVQAEGNNKYLAQLDDDSTRVRFPVAVLMDVTAVNVDLSVSFKPVSGRVDQGAGLVWRFRDEDNYYVVRANALEDNMVLYKVEHGRRTDLPLKGAGRTYGKDVEVPAGRWSQLSVHVAGNLFQVFLNRDKLFEVEDGTFSNAGKVGLWTKADSVTYFDDLSIAVRRHNSRGRVSVEFDIQVPRDLEVSAKSVSGDIVLDGINGVVRGETVSGDVEATSLAELRRAQSVSGDVDACVTTMR